MVDVTIRRAGVDDALVVAALHLQFARELGVLATRRIRPLPMPGSPDASWLYLTTHFVAPDHRSRGVGQALAEGLLDWARGTDVAWIRVNATDANARDFYGRYGFTSPERLMELDLRETT